MEQIVTVFPKTLRKVTLGDFKRNAGRTFSSDALKRIKEKPPKEKIRRKQKWGGGEHTGGEKKIKSKRTQTNKSEKKNINITEKKRNKEKQKRNPMGGHEITKDNKQKHMKKNETMKKRNM